MFHSLRISSATFLVVAIAAVGSSARADSVAQEKFQRAFFLEEHKHDLAAAEKLYVEVAGDSSADAALKAEAKARRDGCREEIACSDFARLMPANAWAYVELNKPGEQILTLLGQLGMLRDGADVAAKKASQQVAISPELVHELIGIRGVAAAVTGFDPVNQIPHGVAVLHPGKLEVIRALLETVLPIQCEASEAIEGFATFQVEKQAYVTITSRLIVVSPQRELIEGVVDRLRGDDKDSLATNPEMAEAMKARGENLLYFCVNFKPIMPLIQAGMAAGATQSHEIAMATTLLDPKSLRSLSGRAGFDDDGFHFDFGMNLDKGHHNLAFNFLRLPAIDSAALKRVPAGAAGFFTMSLNEAGSRYQAKATGKGESKEDAKGGENPPVTFVDIGREIFANIIGVTAFALPSSEASGGEALPMPDAALMFTVNDPSKSEALWGLFLGVASMAAGGGTIDGTAVDVEGAKARRFTLPDGITLYFATSGNAVLISPSRNAIGRAVATQRGGKSIADDAAFSKSLARLGPSSTLAVFAHPGRCIELGKAYMDRDELKEVQPFVETMKDTVGSLVCSHGDSSLGVSLSVTGIPKIGPVLSKMVLEEIKQERGREGLARRVESRDPHEALAALEQKLAENPTNAKALRAKFDLLAVKLHDREAAEAVGEQLQAALNDDAKELNNFAWALVDGAKYGRKYGDLALRISQRSNELTGMSQWMFVDTLAHAKFATGDVAAAIELERKALELVGDDSRRNEVQRALDRFQKSPGTADVAKSTE